MSWGIRTTSQLAKLMDPEMPLKAVHMSCSNIMQEPRAVGMQNLEAQKKSLKTEIEKRDLEISTAVFAIARW